MELNEPSAKYLVQTAHKQTELGTLPVDWEVIQLGNLDPFVTSGSRGWARYYSETGSTFLRITNLSRDTIYPDLSNLRYVSIPANDSEGERTKLVPGDVLISITADVGIVGYVSESVPTPAFVNQHIALVRFSPENLDTKYLSYFLAGSASQSALRALADSGAKAGMNLNTVLSVKAALPPTSEEQKAIADALTDADALIESLEQLLAKKRQIKQGAMQELLTGQRRLPGFIDDWVPGVLGDALGELVAGVSVNSEANGTTEGAPSVLKTSAICDGQFDPTECKAIAKADVGRAQTTPRKDSLLVSRMNTPDLVGEVGYVDADYPLLFLPDRVWMAQAKHGSHVNMRWLVSLLSSAPYKQRIRDTATGTSGSMKNISKAALRSLPVHFPCGEEQTAIASVLSDMDAEITALEARLTKARQLKQGMAQALLTGRIRLV